VLEAKLKPRDSLTNDRTAVILALDPDKRWQVLARVQPNVLEGLPHSRKSAGGVIIRMSSSSCRNCCVSSAPLWRPFARIWATAWKTSFW
jgi:hypothetical protein